MTHIPNINRLIRKFITETILNSDIEIITELMEKNYHIPVEYSLEVYHYHHFATLAQGRLY
jgi:hypothetical protein